jgi:DNA-binding XRE family transcriptional regulator
VKAAVRTVCREAWRRIRESVIAIEGGKYAPSLELAFRLAAVFGKPLEEVFQYEAGGKASRKRSG